MFWTVVMGVTTGCDRDVRPVVLAAERGEEGRNPIVIADRRPMRGVALSAASDSDAVPCGTCHRGRAPDRSVRSSDALDTFHDDLHFSHRVTCVSCHDPDGYDALKLADGTRIDYADAERLCAQCHGLKKRDYDAGAHGGWNGYWDLSRGPRLRNRCTHCHDPHDPAFPHMQPTFKPRDRFLEPDDGGQGVVPRGEDHRR